MKMKSTKIRHFFEAVLTTLLFALQNIIYGSYCISIMFIPLFAYIVSLVSGHPNLQRDINVLLFSKEFMFGRVIAFAGFTILLLAGTQLLYGYVRHKGLVKTGPYSIVRHPQYTGIMVMTLGLTVMVMTLSPAPQPILMWLMQMAGYIALARYEEWHLEKKYEENYLEYKKHVPFVFPIKCPSKISETVLAILVSVIIAFILFVFPYDLIRFL
jgi:protein-S-isoprenylcysteine O-methyltransferase Ste14